MAGGVKSLIDGVEYSIGSPPVPAADGGFVGLFDFAGYGVGTSTRVVVICDFSELSVTGFAPTIAITSGANAQPGVGEASFTGFVPTLVNPVAVTPGVGSALAEGFSPLALVDPGVPNLTITGYAPGAARWGDCITADSTFITADSTAFSADLVSGCSHNTWETIDDDTTETWDTETPGAHTWTPVTETETLTWTPDSVESDVWTEGDAATAASWTATSVTRIGWQQLAGVEEADSGIDFVLKVDDQFPLAVSDTRPSYIIDDIEAP